MPVKDAPEHRNKLEQLNYLAGLITVVNYLDDTGQEYHAQRVLLAEEWKKAFTEFCETINEENREHEARTSRS